MAGRKRHSAEDIVRKLRRADELAAEGKTGEEIAAELEVSAATLYNWRRPPNTRAMGSGAPGRRYATTRARRST
jgi:transposase-like protein